MCGVRAPGGPLEGGLIAFYVVGPFFFDLTIPLVRMDGNGGFFKKGDCMIFEEMIKTECTDERYEAWEKYRDSLTDFILDGIEHYYRKKKIKSMGVRRLSAEIGLESLLSEQKNKPTVAIWGAGGGNDIDLPRLAKYFHLVLIDHNLEQLQNTCERFGLTEQQCSCVDLQFWHISIADYKRIEAMLVEGSSDEIIIRTINEIIMRMPLYEYAKLPKYDFSICVGLASQLNARLAMLFTLHGRGTEFSDYLLELNDIAVNKLADFIYNITKNTVMFGYEVTTLKNTEAMLADLLTYEPEEWEQKKEWPPHSLISDISGNDILSEWICENIKEGNITADSFETLVWPFAAQKQFIMLFCYFSIIKNC